MHLQNRTRRQWDSSGTEKGRNVGINGKHLWNGDELRFGNSGVEGEGRIRGVDLGSGGCEEIKRLNRECEGIVIRIGGGRQEYFIRSVIRRISRWWVGFS